LLSFFSCNSNYKYIKSGIAQIRSKKRFDSKVMWLCTQYTCWK